ncbi:DnaJ-domain-containing protein [Microthyrium microscopicum]|uniref:DnaJ-domain-containing protein n=1 Tax=Microthyrium microscopicum TaxID=703497 RepID=A0A6A6UR94_9PEZI|nr:DnaJ-domain-containing protein [Microthyrium microscopicum]
MSATEELSDEPPTSINPYRVLDLEKDATADQIKSAYRKAALKNHPDKVAESEKDEAHTKFQEIAFAYAILSDPRRRSRYDTTGRTTESLSVEDDDFNWSDFFRAQFKEVITTEAIEQFKKEYQGSEEEKLAVIEAYVNGEGDMDALFEHVMLSNPLEDEDRFRAIIDNEIEEKRVEAYDAYTKETKKQKNQRQKAARKEAKEAEEMAKELGVADKLHASNGKKKASKSTKSAEADEPDLGGLTALIQNRQKERKEQATNFLADLEAKFAPKKGKRPAEDEPPEEMFREAEERQKRRKGQAAAGAERPIASPRKSRRTKK